MKNKKPKYKETKKQRKMRVEASENGFRWHTRIVSNKKKYKRSRSVIEEE